MPGEGRETGDRLAVNADPHGHEPPAVDVPVEANLAALVPGPVEADQAAVRGRIPLRELLAHRDRRQPDGRGRLGAHALGRLLIAGRGIRAAGGVLVPVAQVEQLEAGNRAPPAKRRGGPLTVGRAAEGDRPRGAARSRARRHRAEDRDEQLPAGPFPRALHGAEQRPAGLVVAGRAGRSRDRAEELRPHEHGGRERPAGQRLAAVRGRGASRTASPGCHSQPGYRVSPPSPARSRWHPRSRRR